MVLKRGKELHHAAAGKTVEEALRELGILPETVLAVRAGKIVPLSHRLEEGEEL
ncbi:hypothetical protein H5T52_05525, partial [Candidatus Bipolaricaulota bacterium]|nr:hypothetical protein [Candidatus Bipolaricaulota bacterium]